MANVPPELDHFIAIDQHAIKVYKAFFAFLILVGVAFVVVTLVFPFPLLLTLGGALILTVSGFPLKEYLARRDRITSVELIKEKWQALIRSPHPPEAELDRLEKFLWKLYEQRALG